MVASVQRRAESAEELIAEVTRIVREASGVGAGRELPCEEPLGSLGLDSLAIVNVVAAVEGRYRARARPMRSGTIAAASRSRASPLQSGIAECDLAERHHAAVTGTTDQPGVSRVERLFLQLEGRGPGGRVAAGALHRTRHRGPLAARQAALRRPHARARRRPARCPAARRRHDRSLRRRLRRAAGRDLDEDASTAHAQPISDGACREASTALRPGRAGASSPTTCSGRSGAEDVTTSPGTCFGLNLYERRESRGRGIGLALLAASLPYTRDLGFPRQATIVLERNRPMIAAATQLPRLHGLRPRRSQRAARPGALELAAPRVDRASARVS